MERVADDKLVNEAVSYIQANYKFEDVLSDYGYLERPHVRNGNQLKVICDFHGEKTPSLGVNLDTNLFHCLGGCGAGGNLVNFITLYRKKVQHTNTNFYLVLDSILKEDPAMQLKIGATTIFKSHSTPLSEIATFKLNKSMKFNIIDKRPSTLIELSKRIKKEFKGNIDVILTSFALVDSDMSPEDIYDSLVNRKEFIEGNSNNPSKTTLSIEALIEDE